MGYITYDLETYPNVFTATFYDGLNWNVFEISNRKNQLLELQLYLVKHKTCEFVGYNNEGFDYPILHRIITNECVTTSQIYNLVTMIIGNDDRSLFVYDNDRILKQVDLYKIWHFDNKNKRTSLKYLEFAMRMDSIEDLPFSPGSELKDKDIDVLIKYNIHDVKATHNFLELSKEQLRLREELTEQYGFSFTNFNDTKIGSKILAAEMGVNDYRIKGTFRAEIKLGDLVIPWVEFKTPEFNRVLDFFKSNVITETKGVFEGLKARVDRLWYVYGQGGIHGSLKNYHDRAENDYLIIDLDVTSYYPNLAIQYESHPAHLGKQFCSAYKAVFDKRKKYPKGSALNAAFKLALNGSYGNSNSIYSWLYDPAFTMFITINGQLLISLLAEMLLETPSLKVLQVNTDGITIKVRKDWLSYAEVKWKEWESKTKLELERADYKEVFIRDVNNYCIVKTDDSLKLKGAYANEKEWHKDQSQLVVPKAAVDCLTKNITAEEALSKYTDPFDYLSVAKGKLDLNGERQQRVFRYYVSYNGGELKRIHGDREISIAKDYLVSDCNNIKSFDWTNLNVQYYLNEVKKLTEVFKNE